MTTTRTRKAPSNEPPAERTPDPAAPAEAAPRQAAPPAPQVSDDLDAVRRALADPFPASVVGWKPQTAKDGRALAVAYIDARDVADRLDAVVGIARWKAGFLEHGDGTVTCTLSLKLDGEWVPKQDVGGESEQKDSGDRKKAAYSDALKRAAVHWGVGRYLYFLPAVLADYDPKKGFTRNPPLAAWALPGGAGRPPDQMPPAQCAAPHEPQPTTPAAPPKQNGERSLLDRLHDRDKALTDEGLCKAGAYVAYVIKQTQEAGAGPDPKQWGAGDWQEAGRAAKHFELEQLRDVAERLLRAKGKRHIDVTRFLKLTPGTAVESLDAAQWRRVLGALRELPDAPAAKAS